MPLQKMLSKISFIFKKFHEKIIFEGKTSCGALTLYRVSSQMEVRKQVHSNGLESRLRSVSRSWKIYKAIIQRFFKNIKMYPIQYYGGSTDIVMN